MKKPGNEAVRDLLDGLQSADAEAYEVVTAIRDLIYEVHPATTEKMMYGGIVFFIGKEMYSGVFANKKHVTLELSKGFLMEDPAGHLEGKGKYRRHLKIRSLEDITAKQLPFYLAQAV